QDSHFDTNQIFPENNKQKNPINTVKNVINQKPKEKSIPSIMPNKEGMATNNVLAQTPPSIYGRAKKKTSLDGSLPQETEKKTVSTYSDMENPKTSFQKRIAKEQALELIKGEKHSQDKMGSGTSQNNVIKSTANDTIEMKDSSAPNPTALDKQPTHISLSSIYRTSRLLRRNTSPQKQEETLGTKIPSSNSLNINNKVQIIPKVAPTSIYSKSIRSDVSPLLIEPKRNNQDPVLPKTEMKVDQNPQEYKKIPILRRIRANKAKTHNATTPLSKANETDDVYIPKADRSAQAKPEIFADQMHKQTHQRSKIVENPLPIIEVTTPISTTIKQPNKETMVSTQPVMTVENDTKSNYATIEITKKEDRLIFPKAIFDKVAPTIKIGSQKEQSKITTSKISPEYTQKTTQNTKNIPVIGNNKIANIQAPLKSDTKIYQQSQHPIKARTIPFGAIQQGSLDTKTPSLQIKNTIIKPAKQAKTEYLRPKRQDQTIMNPKEELEGIKAKNNGSGMAPQTTQILPKQENIKSVLQQESTKSGEQIVREKNTSVPETQNIKQTRIDFNHVINSDTYPNTNDFEHLAQHLQTKAEMKLEVKEMQEQRNMPEIKEMEQSPLPAPVTLIKSYIEEQKPFIVSYKNDAGEKVTQHLVIDKESVALKEESKPSFANQENKGNKALEGKMNQFLHERNRDNQNSNMSFDSSDNAPFMASRNATATSANRSVSFYNEILNQQIVSKVSELHKSGQSEIKMSFEVNTLNMGKLNIQMEKRATTLKINFTTDSKEKQDILKENMSELASNLKQFGFENIEVNIDLESSADDKAKFAQSQTEDKNFQKELYIQDPKTDEPFEKRDFGYNSFEYTA
ncbi:MAG: flagellar hook-length control protein FliK, partial [Candidatus Cloacimonetes bacterium]|nr:flagellar hook-length control protein FliK [Candidatus Cloacimonadota bacterium]